MIQCKDVTEEASNYLNGDLPLRKRAALLFHLIICKCCRNYLQQIRNTINTIGIVKPKEKDNTDMSDLAKKLHDLHCKDH